MDTEVTTIRSNVGKTDSVIPGVKIFLAEPSKKEVVDKNAALERTMGDEQFLLDLLEELVMNLPRISERIKKAIIEKNAGSVAIEANRLAGAAGNLGAMRLSEAAFCLEKLARKGCIENAHDAFKQLIQESDRLILYTQTS